MNKLKMNIPVRISMTGAPVEYVVPSNCPNVTFQPTGGDVQLSDNGSGPGTFTLFNGNPYPFKSQGFSNMSFWFNGAIGTYVEVLYLTGVL